MRNKYLSKIKIRSIINDPHLRQYRMFALKIAGMIMVAAFFLMFFAKYVPFNMDEFGPYLPISYLHSPLNSLNVFRGSLTGYYLTPFPHISLPLRAYHYIGSLDAILYYPLFILWSSPHSARLLGLIMLAFQAYFLHKIFKTDILITYIFLLLFISYAFPHIVNAGPVVLQPTSALLICYLMWKWMASLKNNPRFIWGYPFIIGIVLFLGVWSKLTYFFMLPGLSLLILYYLFENRARFRGLSRLKDLIKSLLVLAASAGIPTFILLNSTDPYGGKYFWWLTRSHYVEIFRLHHILNVLSFIANPQKICLQIFLFGPDRITIEGILLALSIITFIVWGTVLLHQKRVKIGFVLVNLLGFIMALLLMAGSNIIPAEHHFVLSLPFLILALTYIFSRLYSHKFAVLLAAVFLMVNIYLYYNITNLQPWGCNHPGNVQLNELINRKFADRYVIVVTDWGMYYIKALYGPRSQCVLYMEPFNSEEQVTALKNILHKTGRKALFLKVSDSTMSPWGYIENPPGFVKANFPSVIELRTRFDTGPWRVLYEK